MPNKHISLKFNMSLWYNYIQQVCIQSSRKERKEWNKGGKNFTKLSRQYLCFWLVRYNFVLQASWKLPDKFYFFKCCFYTMKCILMELLTEGGKGMYFLSVEPLPNHIWNSNEHVAPIILTQSDHMVKHFQTYW